MAGIIGSIVRRVAGGDKCDQFAENAVGISEGAFKITNLIVSVFQSGREAVSDLLTNRASIESRIEETYKRFLTSLTETGNILSLCVGVTGLSVYAVGAQTTLAVATTCLASYGAYQVAPCARLRVTKKRAEKGDIEAQYRMGNFFLRGYGIRPLTFGLGIIECYPFAFEWFRQAAIQGHRGAQLAMANLCLQNGDPFLAKEARSWFASSKEFISEQRTLYLIKENSKTTHKSEEEANVAYAIGRRALGDGVLGIVTHSIPFFEAAASQRHSGALYELGLLKFYGYSPLHLPDRDAAYKYFRLSALYGNVEALYMLAVCHELKSRDGLKIAFSYYVLAADRGNALACNRVGHVFKDGGVVEPNEFFAEFYFTQAFKIWKKTASTGDAEACYQLGLCYAEGKVIPKDVEMARSFFTKAEEKGIERASIALWHLLKEMDAKAAFSHLLKFVKAVKDATYDNGLIGTAYFYLGECYAKGIGVERDHEKAIEAFKCGSKLGYDKCGQELANRYREGGGAY